MRLAILTRSSPGGVKQHEKELIPNPLDVIGGVARTTVLGRKLPIRPGRYWTIDGHGESDRSVDRADIRHDVEHPR